MSNNKQSSSVEWLINQLQKSKDWHRVLNEISQMSSAKVDILEQAKAMHKNEVKKHFNDGYDNGADNWGDGSGKTAEQYYNENYGK